jgi:RNA polymerase sigma-70 factor (ECF subfamily)
MLPLLLALTIHVGAKEINVATTVTGQSEALNEDASIHDDLSSFLRVRSRLFGIAYRIVGRTADAEDIVQDVWVRWQMTDRTLVRDAMAFLATTTTRLAINCIQCARSLREMSLGAVTPEPLDTTTDPAERAELDQALASGVLVLLERLSSSERAAFILREAFDYSYRDIARVLQLQEANARQVVTRARQRLVGGSRMPSCADEGRQLLGAFVAAAQSGEVTVLEHMLQAHVSATAQAGRRAQLAA